MEIKAEQIQELLDKDAIRDCLYRYCRGIDNADEEALRSSYWPNAIDQHGAYNGSAIGFINYAMKALPHFEVSIHQITNILIDYHIDFAYVESKFSAIQRSPNATDQIQESFIWGRYADYFEKRNGEWRIAKRTVIYDWLSEYPVVFVDKEKLFGARTPIGTKWPHDTIYQIFKKNK
ncbi:TPA: nuclear transport factor 2 family protein [Acinetobacter baumannii]|uniref:nuclear transport factor 2 family protein n=1 Tax=Acinetobacter baumannii TaxID=470 RepID=UPI0015801164|nr:nuclear transport factor 2 family protein [Acinetobacter baumannii]MDC5215474.1 nuclear transport factor 2 family protein [Acinetobacter baumannii]NUG32723.1 nuclear transport factor 2 family protein [Acinetobacter baumannii]HEN9518923.1 nuclear transport factor 2 family protein [Acinetobacter baumannii]